MLFLVLPKAQNFFSFVKYMYIHIGTFHLNELLQNIQHSAKLWGMHSSYLMSIFKGR